VRETLSRMILFKRAIDETPAADTALQHRVRIVTDKLKDAQELLNGDPTMGNRNEASPTVTNEESERIARLPPGEVCQEPPSLMESI